MLAIKVHETELLLVQFKLASIGKQKLESQSKEHISLFSSVKIAVQTIRTIVTHWAPVKLIFDMKKVELRNPNPTR
jgi:hypothetical protein